MKYARVWLTPFGGFDFWVMVIGESALPRVIFPWPSRWDSVAAAAVTEIDGNIFEKYRLVFARSVCNVY